MKKMIPIVGLVAIAALVFWRMSGGDSSTERDEVTQRSPNKPTQRAIMSARPVTRTQSLDVEFDVDKRGDLRLEGQVIDSEQLPVGGATVTLRTTPPRTVKSDEDGSFAFEHLIARSYTLAAHRGGRAAGPVNARLSEHSEPVILRLEAAATVTVQVMSAAADAPLAGATVEIRGAVRVHTTTDGDGIANLAGIPAGFHQLAASASGYASEHMRLRIPRGDVNVRERITLRMGAAVSGRVIDDQGAGVTGAKVVYRNSSAGWWQQPDSSYDAVITGADGAFAFPALPAGTFYLQANHDSFARGHSDTIELDGVTARTGVDIQLASGVTLAGTVVDQDGRAVPSAGVRVLVDAGRRWGQRPRQTFTDEQGAFEFRGLPHNGVRVAATSETAASNTETVDLTDAAGTVDVQLRMERTGRIAGRVVDSNGEPVDGAQVMLRPDIGERGRGRRGARRGIRTEIRLRGMHSALTDAGGGFEFTGIDDSAYEVVASPPGSTLSRRQAFRSDGVPARAGDTDVRIELEARGQIEGRVAFDDGSHPEVFTVSVGGFRAAPVPVSDADGKFQLVDIEPGEHRLMIRGAGFDDKRVAGISVDAGETVDLGTVTVVQGRSVSGRVVTATGTPIANASVHIGAYLRGSGTEIGSSGFGPFARGVKSTESDEDGSFSLAGIGKGTLTMVAEHVTEGRSSAIQIPAQAKALSDVQMIILPPASVSGKVLVEGMPTASIRVSAQSQTSPGANYSVRSGPDGVYKFERLAPDTYLVSASIGDNPRDGMGMHSVAADVEAGANLTLDLPISLGSIDLEINLQPTQGEAGFTRIHVVQGALKATSLQELDAALAGRQGGFAAMAFSPDGSPTTVEGLMPDTYSVCVVPFPRELAGPRQIFPYMREYGERLAVSCTNLEVADSPDEQQVAIPMTVPVLLSSPDGDT